MTRVTKEMLELVVLRLNTITNSPTKYCVDGKVQPDCYHIDSQNGGWSLARTSSHSSGEVDVLRTGHTSRGHLYELIHAYIAGYEACKADAKLQEVDALLSTVVTSLRLPVNLVETIEAMSKGAGISRNAVVNEMLKLGLEKLTGVVP